jgi:hypothetical protein
MDAPPGFGGTNEFQLNWEAVKDLSLQQVSARMHSFPEDPAICINHPVLPPDLGYFLPTASNGNPGWSPPAPLDSAGTFDAIEILNGFNALEDLPVLMRDWFFLLNSGFRVTALGSSDTHRMSDVKGGYPRTWLRTNGDDPTLVDGTMLADAIRNGRAVASTGPFITLLVDGTAQIGDLVSDTSGAVQVELSVDAPAWIDVNVVRVYVNGAKVQEFPVAPGLHPLLDMKWRQPLPSGDAWIAATASGKKPLPAALMLYRDPSTGARDVPAPPFAIANPVYIDGTGDGKWSPTIARPAAAAPAAPPRPRRRPHPHRLRAAALDKSVHLRS